MSDIYYALIESNRKTHDAKTEAYHDYCKKLGYDKCYTCGKRLKD